MSIPTADWATSGRVLGLGIDLIEINRIDRAIVKRPRFVDRVFTDAEKEYCAALANPARHWAVRFAGKEAVMKSLGVGPGRVAWRDISIRGPGKPIVELSGGAIKRADQLGVVRVEISLSHSTELAIAVAAALAE